MAPITHEIVDTAPGVFAVLLEPCSCQVLRHVLRPQAGSVVWLVAHHPHPVVEWVDMRLPLVLGQEPEPVRTRLPRYDLQFPLTDFLARLPRLRAPGGMLAIQMARPVPNTLTFDTLASNPHRHAILRQNSWLLSFDLPHDGEYAWIECPDRAYLDQLLADPVFASRDLP